MRNIVNIWQNVFLFKVYIYFILMTFSESTEGKVVLPLAIQIKKINTDIYIYIFLHMFVLMLNSLKGH